MHAREIWTECLHYLLQCTFCTTQIHLCPTLNSLCSVIDSSRWWPVTIFKYVNNFFSKYNRRVSGTCHRLHCLVGAKAIIYYSFNTHCRLLSSLANCSSGLGCLPNRITQTFICEESETLVTMPFPWEQLLHLPFHYFVQSSRHIEIQRHPSESLSFKCTSPCPITYQPFYLLMISQ